MVKQSNRQWSRWLSTSLLITGLSAAGAASAESLNFAHVYETSEPYHEWALWAADEIEQRTDGRYTIEVHPASSLGKEEDINEGLTLGTVDIIYTGSQFAGRAYGPIGIAGAPYMFRDFDHWQAYAESDLFQEIAQGYQDQTGNVPVALNYYGERHVTSNKPIMTPEDMRNLKIRTPNAPMYMMFPEAVGANPSPIAFDEVYLALQQGVVDAQENPLPTIRAKAFYEVQDHINLTGHITDSLLTIIGGPLWDRLSEEDREIFREVYQEAGKKITADIQQQEQELVAWFEEQGVTVNEVDREPFREAVIPEHNGDDATWDQETYDRLQEIGQ
ncbi:sialic acid TRAP transporter substrate-binding protein SiaP [Halomonas sp. MCCC 1A17488]|uniref:sialic acid TRAP transporter substrate-binding protein SiaP n=1 Tax=unclassified Halomonas TaxID=2609666 RepID=UPI0018D2363A|nr:MULTISPECIES: sialic acid TRAP transporter substrate-binding protein SiaP [unclassified Halomonas]MCE8015008.1 sialic acid TRAP transporter substrate-binding protein SiaP [Halomonas sp. MCCC 1A17488]MCG3238341.1 sialic acid TRAP transporter substrate-binding protein SiaP [Halomonas sp. MCCC 1A17488]QPP47910.1 sialic acid TRAP transporter substrate-binding protein SiaP [Halomonas sp. SS10-MC5]